MIDTQKRIALIAAVAFMAGLVGLLAVAAAFLLANLGSGRSPQLQPDASHTSMAAPETSDSLTDTFSSTLASEQSIPPVETSKQPALVYDWKPDTLYRWRFEMKSSGAATERTFSGTAAFTARKQKASRLAPETQSATGTAFVVNEAGWLVTCAHVVDHGADVRVRLGDQEYPAKVVGSDAANDLALLKINANNLQPLPLATNDAVELGQEIRCVGFPLTDLLGKSVKVSRGTVSGQVQLDARELFQIDAAINPGNSGGPVVDARGNVLGVASQKVQGAGVSNIGFCIPSDILNQFLKDSQVAINTRLHNADIDGPTLARQVIPSVALVEVELETLEQYELTDYSEFDQTGDWFELPRQYFRTTRTKSLIATDGTLVDNQGLDAPFMLGPVSTLGVLPLPKPWQTSWGGSSEFQLTLVIEEDPFEALLRGRFGRLRPLESQVVSIRCEQYDRSKIVETIGNTVRIEREIVMTSLAEPKFEQRIQWDYQFDLQTQLVKEAHAKGSLQVRDEKISSISLDLSHTHTVDIAGVNRDGRLTTPPISDNVPSKPIESLPEDLATALEKLADENTALEDRVTQLNQLAAMRWNAKHRQKVVNQLSSELQRKEAAVHLAAIKALTNWDAATRVDDVIKFLKHPSPSVRGATVEYLSSMQDGSAALPLVDALKYPDLRDAIYAALRSIGPTAEAGPIKMLSHPEESIRVTACAILEEIGTQSCVAELQRLAQNAGQDGAQAKRTLAKLGISVSSPELDSPELDSPELDSSEENPFAPKKRK